ncbi:G-type lectin S-receptor-like serine/threonine-protein kinase [Camellia lanceoleosa]|uniref:G-type lectin S-receptor-like serine/threonine-protein kinase n=1 Tax=Camellia lanceoleosa TaxID=1840588 RepID=A0ACC0HIE0_9ERIC|nr:G-type lectin S-receptor-like serine/threonine-protein kinase [Camellia lanceoleosa]
MGIKNNSSFIFSIFFLLFFSFINHLSHGADTISANQSLSGNQTITSAGGNFELGFYKPDGNLVILNESQTLIWSTNQNSTTSNSVVAVLGDDGNLILRGGSNSYQPIWQSFDHPAHTWLPGGKIVYNKLTNTHQRLTSWKNSEDPSTGLYSLNLDANNSHPTTHLVGKHKAVDLFCALPRQQCEVYDFCGQYGICNNIIQPFCNCLAGFNRKSLNDWNLSDYSGGCVRRTELLCGNITAANQEKDRFWEISNTRLPEFPQSMAVGSAAECESSCLNNCSCTLMLMIVMGVQFGLGSS